MFASIRIRILVACVAILVGALVVTGVMNYAVARAYSEAAVSRNLNEISDAYAHAIGNWMSGKAAILSSISAAQLDGNLTTLLTQLKLSGDFSTAFVAYPDKRLISTSNFGRPPSQPIDPTVRPYYTDAVAAGRMVLTKPYVNQITHRLVVTFARPVMADGALEAVVGVVVSLDEVSASVNAVHPTPNSFAFVVDIDGTIIAHPDVSLNLKPATDLAPMLTAQALSRLESARDPMRVEIGGAPKLLHAERIEGTNWTLVIALDRADAMAGLHALAMTELVSLIVVAVVAALLIGALTVRPFKRLSEVRDAMREIGSGDGDLTRRLPIGGNDEVAAIARSFNLFVDKMNVVLIDIRSGSEAVNSVAGEISEGNQDLSARTEHAASSLEQTAASMQEIYGSVVQSSELAKQANELAETSSVVASRGGAVVADVVSIMEAISESSKRMTGIIGIIEGVASQTNILALNAAVEAARAGEQGRGFAVVAGEVRTLAQRCAQATKEIKQLIEEAAGQVGSGAQLASNAGTTMHEVVGSVRRVGAIVAEIALAASEQSVSIGQVNQAVSQLDELTQRNAALVEESSAVAQFLEEQSGKLSEAVGRFRLAAA